MRSFHGGAVSLVGRFEDCKPANQRNIPEDQYAMKVNINIFSTWWYVCLICIATVVGVHVLCCDSGTRTCFVS
jgi:hypothetical protein